MCESPSLQRSWLLRGRRIVVRIAARIAGALVAVAALLDGTLLEHRHHVLAGALIFVAGVAMLLVVSGASEPGQ